MTSSDMSDPIRISRRAQGLPGYPLAEIPAIKRRLAAAGMDIIDLGAGDNDTPPPAVAVAAMIEALANPLLSKYGFQQGLPAYRQAIASWMQRRFGQTFDPVTETLPLIGSKEGLSHLPLSFADAGDVVIVPEPGYQAYLGGALLSGATPHVVQLRPENDFLVDLETVPAEMLAKTKLVILNYPNNPTAAIAPRDYLQKTVDICRAHGIVLAYDNAYCELTFDGYVAPSIFEFAGAREVAVEFFSLSKSYSMTGWRIGFALGRPELIGALTRVKSYVDTGPWLAIQHAAAKVLDASESIVPSVRDELQHRRDAAITALAEIGLHVEAPKAAMYIWVPLPPHLPSASFTRQVLEETGVVLLPGSGFGAGGEGFFRIALTMGAERITEGVRRIGTVLAAAGAAV